MFESFQKYLKDKIPLSDEESGMIQAVSVIKKLRKNQYLLQEGDIWRFNAFVCQGCLRTYSVDDKGNEHIINFAQEGWWIGDRESLATGNPSKYNIDAVEESIVLLINKDNFTILMKNIPQFAELVIQIIERSFVASQERINANISGDAEKKYQYFMGKYPRLALRIPQHMIASYLGITPETLSRVRKNYQKKAK